MYVFACSSNTSPWRAFSPKSVSGYIKPLHDACVEDIDYRTPRGLEKGTMLSMTSLEWIRNGRNLVFTGPTGTGKTWLACAIGNAACRAGLSTQFIRVPLLLETLVAAHATVSFNQMLERLKKIDLLILDDWGLEPFKGRAQNDILELIESRLNCKSLLITAQAPMTLWHDLLVAKPIADALMDRLVHSSYNIKLTGESLRTKANAATRLAKSKKA